MKKVTKLFILCVLFMSASSIATAIEIKGTVVDTSGLDVTVKTVGKNSPASGDLMEISFSIPGGDTLSIGTWKVTSVSGRIVSATVVENTGTPSKGQQAVIFAENPVSAETVRKKQTSNSNNNEQRVYSATISMSPEAQEIVSLLQSSDPAQVRNGGKRAHRNFSQDAGVLAVVADVLNKGYTEKPRDRHHVDSMSWLCNALGASKDIKYKDLLTLVSKKSPSKKVRKYAIKNIRSLR